ncbi:hypothetical protein M3196_00130 [Fictibacillus nanhaiensis]|uniref:XkdQ/YqbQ family protein n=1 Tax=Fictibacillus nanhaiensis TaxID=742169 RepID=UPI00203C19AE|nr:hypothetical protein [Fictibacillus nanhaiensis]MCM3730076.1 hypothetical protein [Fictibacillus nanhaiensis]
MRLVVNNQEIKYTSLDWSGSKYNAARQISYTYPSNLYYSVVAGNTVTLFDGTTKLFQGTVFIKEKNHKSNEMSITAYDPLIYFLQSEGAYNFKTTTLGTVVKRVAADVKVPVGNIADSGTSIKLEPMISENLYEVLMTACKEAKKKTKKVYMPVIENGKLSIIVAGQKVSNFDLLNGINLKDSTYSESIENVKNKIIIVDENGAKIGQVTGEGLTTWGTFQGVYQKEDGKNATTEAKELLHGLDREASIEALGNTKCISGKAVSVKDPITNLTGLFYIDEDTHTWQNGQYSMSLQLNFKNVEENE